MQVNLWPPAPLTGRRVELTERYFGSTYNHSFDLEALDRLSDTGSWEAEKGRVEGRLQSP